MIIIEYGYGKCAVLVKPALFDVVVSDGQVEVIRNIICTVGVSLGRALVAERCAPHIYSMLAVIVDIDVCAGSAEC